MPDPVLPLRFVQLADIVPHETADDRRASRLAEDLAHDAVMRNPPIVVPSDGRFILLDGATRTEALRRLGSPHAVVQEITDTAGSSLETWHHVATDATVDEVLAAMEIVEHVKLDPVGPEAAEARVIEDGGLCSVLTSDGRGFAVFAEPGTSRFEVLGAFATAYAAVANVSRTLNRDLDQLSATYPALAAVVEYPEFTIDQVLDAAASGTLLPAGVTRFVVPGRVLRLDISLELLLADSPLEEKNRWLRTHLLEKERHGRIRYYREPVYLLDE